MAHHASRAHCPTIPRWSNVAHTLCRRVGGPPPSAQADESLARPRQAPPHARIFNGRREPPAELAPSMPCFARLSTKAWRSRSWQIPFANLRCHCLRHHGGRLEDAVWQAHPLQAQQQTKCNCKTIPQGRSASLLRNHHPASGFARFRRHELQGDVAQPIGESQVVNGSRCQWWCSHGRRKHPA